ncbi:MAG: hypothetical protein HOO96_02505 [Polyangiaceae bacterium]|nr:hypothetical protein [Polyangiaceae bacterium]
MNARPSGALFARSPAAERVAVPFDAGTYWDAAIDRAGFWRLRSDPWFCFGPRLVDP